MRLCVLDTIHHAAFNKTDIWASLHPPKYDLKWTTDCTPLYTPSLLELCAQDSSQDAFEYTLSTLPSTPLSTSSSKLPNALDDTPCLLDYTLQSKLSRHSQVHLRVHFQVHSWVCFQGCSQLPSMGHSQPAWLYTPKHALKDSSNCTRWHTPSQLGFTLPSSLSGGKKPPISLKYMLQFLLLGARSRELLSCRCHALGGGWWVAYHGWNHDIRRYHSLNNIFFAATATTYHTAL